MTEIAGDLQEKEPRRKLKEVVSALFRVSAEPEFAAIGDVLDAEPVSNAEKLEARRYAENFFGGTNV